MKLRAINHLAVWKVFYSCGLAIFLSQIFRFGLCVSAVKIVFIYLLNVNVNHPHQFGVCGFRWEDNKKITYGELHRLI